MGAGRHDGRRQYEVLQFRDPAALARVVAYLDERDYTATTTGSAVIRTHPLDLREPWASRPLAMLNIAVIADAGRLVISSRDTVGTAVLAAEHPADARALDRPRSSAEARVRPGRRDGHRPVAGRAVLRRPRARAGPHLR